MSRTIEILVTVVALAAAALFAHSWLDARREQTQLSATLAQQNVLLAQAAAREQQRDAELAHTLAQINAFKQSIRTPQQAAVAIPEAVNPLLPAPVTLAMPKPDAAVNAPATATVPLADLKPLSDMISDCKACRAQLPVLQANLADEEQKVAALATERDAAVKVAHGTFWSRVRHSAKWLAIGAGLGAIAARLVH